MVRANLPTRWLRLDLFEEFRVGEILRASGLTLVADEVIARDDPDVRVVEARGNATAPRARKVDAIKVRQQVHAVRRATKLDDSIASLKVGRRDVQRAESEPFQRLHNSLAILEIGADEEVQILRQPRSAVKCDRVPAHDKKINAGRVEQREQLVQALSNITVNLAVVSLQRNSPVKALLRSHCGQCLPVGLACLTM